MTAHGRHIRFLASVRSEDEALVAVAQGVDIIDCKEPLRGALGALPLDVVARVRRAVPAHVPVSATIGDLPCETEPMVAAARAMAGTGVDFVKAGLFPGDAAREVLSALGDTAIGKARLVAVLFADLEVDYGLIEVAAKAGFAGIMLDTAGKTGGSLLRHRTRLDLEAFVRRARAAGLFAGFAGSLCLDDIAALCALQPDILGFRGALCSGGRRAGALSATCVRAVRTVLDGAFAEAAS